jgi:uncharacterized BrkB/YihY/UPF0761 family membrane protein
MAQIQDIPRLVSEFYELAKAYLVQETVEPAKKLGHFAGFSLGAAALWAVALILISVAGLRAIYSVLPEGAYWEALGYLITVVVLVGFMALLIGLMPDRSVHDTPAGEATEDA